MQADVNVNVNCRLLLFSKPDNCIRCAPIIYATLLVIRENLIRIAESLKFLLCTCFFIDIRVVLASLLPAEGNNFQPGFNALHVDSRHSRPTHRARMQDAGNRSTPACLQSRQAATVSLQLPATMHETNCTSTTRTELGNIPICLFDICLVCIPGDA